MNLVRCIWCRCWLDASLPPAHCPGCGCLPPAPVEHRLPDLMGCPPEKLWRVARSTGCHYATVLAVAGGHTHSNYGQPLPVDRIRAAALLLGKRAA